jgi:hypothetical protein
MAPVVLILSAASLLAQERPDVVEADPLPPEEQRVSPLSPMPANVADVVSEPEFYDLRAFLLSQTK